MRLHYKPATHHLRVWEVTAEGRGKLGELVMHPQRGLRRGTDVDGPQRGAGDSPLHGRWWIHEGQVRNRPGAWDTVPRLGPRRPLGRAVLRTRKDAELRAAILKEQLRRAAQNSLLAYILYTFGENYKVNWHHREVCEAFEDVESGKTPKLMVTMPPRSGKSTIISIHAPAWYLGRHPQDQIIATAYGGELVARFGGKTRELIAVESPPGGFRRRFVPQQGYEGPGSLEHEVRRGLSRGWRRRRHHRVRRTPDLGRRSREKP